MKLRNKKTGEIGYIGLAVDGLLPVAIEGRVAGNAEQRYRTLAELNADWEDVPEEPKCGYIIDPMDEDGYSRDDDCFEESDRQRAKELGIWLKTEEEAKKAVKKLKAWKRLEDKGFRFDGWLFFPDSYHPSQERVREGNILFKVKNDKEVGGLLDTAFGGEE